MTISNKLVANAIFTVVLLGSAGVSGLAAKQLVQSYPEVKTIFNNDTAKVSQVLAQKDAATGTSVDTESAKCLITVSGKTYDVFALKTTHSGGDIFKCNTDMTASFQSQHGTMYTLISKYLVSNTTSNIINTTTSTSNVNNVKGSSVTLAQLKTHNTASSCWIAYSGKVYDVTGNPSWTNCDHHGALGGKDITSIFPHSNSYLSTLKFVGTLNGSTTSSNTNSAKGNQFENSFDDETEDDSVEDKLENEKEDENEWEFEFED